MAMLLHEIESRYAELERESKAVRDRIREIEFSDHGSGGGGYVDAADNYEAEDRSTTEGYLWDLAKRKPQLSHPINIILAEIHKEGQAADARGTMRHRVHYQDYEALLAKQRSLASQKATLTMRRKKLLAGMSVASA